MKTTRLRLLRPVRPGSDRYEPTETVGAVRSPSRGSYVETGTDLPTGAATFVLPAGLAARDDLIEHRRQYFRVLGIAPGNHGVRDELTTEQVDGRIEVLEPLTVGGEPLTVGGEPVTTAQPAPTR